MESEKAETETSLSRNSVMMEKKEMEWQLEGYLGSNELFLIGQY